MKTGVAFAALALATGADAQQTMPQPEVAPQFVYRDPLSIQATYPNGVRVLPYVRYWTPIGHRPLTMDLYLPTSSRLGPSAGAPVILYLHGGGWIGGDTQSSGPFVDFPGLLAEIAGRGFVVASISYRLSGEAGWPAQAEDVKAAVKFLRLKAQSYGIDPHRIAAWGVASGGHLAAIASLTCGVAAFEPRQPLSANNPDTRVDQIVGARVSACIQAAAVWSGVFNMDSIAQHARQAQAVSRDEAGAPEWRLLRCFNDQCSRDQIRAASPITYVSAGAPPMLLIAGTADRFVPHQQTVEMAEALRAAGVPHEVLLIPGADHGLIGPDRESTRQANQRALAATLDFFDRALRLPAAAPQERR